MFYTIYRLYSVRICATGCIYPNSIKNMYKPATRFTVTNIRSPFHIAYSGIHEGIYAKK